jgi:signal transduction histidine kinase
LSAILVAVLLFSSGPVRAQSASARPVSAGATAPADGALERFWVTRRAISVSVVAIFCLQATIVWRLAVELRRRRSTELTLRQANARTGTILRALPELMFVMTVDGVYVDYHAADPTDLFVPPSQFLGKRISEIMPPDLASQFTIAIGRVVETGETSVVRYPLDLNGENRYFEARIMPGAQGHVISIVRDLTEVRRIEQALGHTDEILETTRKQNDDLVGRLIVSQEFERRRVARELHDDIGQKLAMLSIRIDDLANRGQLTGSLPEAVREISREAGAIATDVHQVSHRLHPSKLEAVGLLTALQSLCNEISNQSKVAIACEHDDIPRTIEPEVSLCVYRITQEALHNVVKHSGAPRAVVRLSRERGDLYLQIADQGSGFSQHAAEGGGLGLVSIRERAGVLGGRVAIHSAPGAGTRIGVRVPLDPAARNVPKTDTRAS